ncbi:hypothetical protein G4D82_11915 [Flavobacterium sp. CYK-4]|uniref:hypothetical protein n=1 Tax=Flavobacterium lotistagni TaxID=2709660 RepID=UPI00140E6723|nr:hypothetical protein [Flavobacterium lotistagni]NHM07931.1 hypothetical protein [Flavobacterium lotistagni]
MTTNITTLALNLLVSERIGQRYVFADKIIALVQDAKDDAGQKKDFINVIHTCIENPSSDARNTLFELAQYYNEKINAA